jgi:hypothetical protein
MTVHFMRADATEWANATTRAIWIEANLIVNIIWFAARM